MEKTLYAVNRFGSLIFNIGEGTIIGGVKPFDVDSLRYIRKSIDYGIVDRELSVIHSQLTFTDVRNTEKR